MSFRPNSKDGSQGPFFCNSTWVFDPNGVKAIREELLQEWPNIHGSDTEDSLWKHEWEKHGTCAALDKHFSSDENPGPKDSDPFSAKCLFALKSLSEHFQSKIIQKVKEVTWASTDVAIKASSPLPSIYLSGKYYKNSCLWTVYY